MEEEAMIRWTKESSYEYARRLYKDRENGWIFGVCAGIAEFGGFGVGAVRVIALISLWLFTGFTILAYLLAAVLFRSKPLKYSGQFAEQEFWQRHGNTDNWRHS
jgi:phage shock protein C